MNDLRRSLLLDGEDITAESLRRAYMGIPLTDEPGQTILGLYEKHNTKLKELINIDIAEATHKRHETSKMHVAGFIKYKYEKEDLDIDKIDHTVP
jgi:hypothetical protein